MNMWVMSLLLLVVVICVAGVALYHTRKPLPKGLAFEGDIHHVDSIDFLYDITYPSDGQIVREEMIFPRIIQLIEAATEWIVIDVFLLGGYHDPGQPFEPVSEWLVGKLIEKKQQDPSIRIICLVDEVNTSYGAHHSDLLETLRNFGCEVIITDVNKLRDSNPLYSAVWRIFLQWFGSHGKGWIRNPLAVHAPHVTVRSYLKLLNIKANHRKVFATNHAAVITSANAHDTSAYHSNIGFAIGGSILGDILRSEQAVSNLSQGPQLPVYSHESQSQQTGAVQAQLLTEGKIKRHILNTIRLAETGFEIWITMFYLADANVIQGLLDAAKRGVIVRVILDPNDNAFGKGKIGIPNRPVAASIAEQSNGQIQVRWFNIWKNQYHTKMMCMVGNQTTTIIGGSANFTRRSLGNLNLETDLKIISPSSHPFALETLCYMKRIWNNQGAQFTLPFETLEDALTPLKTLIYQLQELLRFTTY